jgi:deoxycytidylate deaminase
MSISRNLGPPDKLLESVAPMNMWYRSISRAASCTHKRHRTGCIIFDNKTGKVLASGTAHPADGYAIRSIHAERDALRKVSSEGGSHSLLIVTLTKTGNFAQVSRPCTHCTEAILQCPEIDNIIYAERTNDGTWAVRDERPQNLRPLMEPKFV